MDDNGNIIYYVVLGLIYVISRFFGKKKKAPVKPQPKRSVNDPQRRSEPKPIQAPTAEKEAAPMSFEDILRELSGVPQPKPEPEPEPVTYAAPAPREVKQPGYLQDLEERPQPAYALDGMDSIAVDYKVPKPIGYDRLTEPEAAALRRKDLSFKRDSHYKIEQKGTVDYLEIFSEKNGAAKAFVMSEIFNRKY